MECKIDLAALMREEGLPLYVYADGTVTHKMVPGKIKIGKIWGCLDGVEPKEKLPCKEQFFSKPFTEEDAREQAEEEQQQTKLQQLQEQETVQVEKSAIEVETFFSEVKVGWYAFAGGKFSPDPDSYPNCQGVVGWVNPDKSAPQGQRGLIVTPDEVKKAWSDKHCETNIKDEYDGKGNTEKLIVYGKAHGISFPAAEWRVRYSKNGVRPGEGFMPAKEQLKRIVANRELVNPALQGIGGIILDGWYWSSSEYSYGTAWLVYAYDGSVYGNSKYYNLYVRCVLAF
mgnify:CR=1 FL=1